MGGGVLFFFFFVVFGWSRAIFASEFSVMQDYTFLGPLVTDERLWGVGEAFSFTPVDIYSALLSPTSIWEHISQKNTQEP